MSTTINLAEPFRPETYAAWLATWTEERDRLEEDRAAAWQAIEARLGDDAYELLRPLDDAYGFADIHDEARLIEELCAHLPGLTGAIRLAYDHSRGMVTPRGMDHCQL